MKKKILTTLFIAFSVIVSGLLVFSTNNANADSGTLNGIYTKILLNEMSQCFSDDYMYFTATVGATDNRDENNPEYSTFGSLLKTKKAKDVDSALMVPTGGVGNGNNIDNEQSVKGISCYALFLGDVRASGLKGYMTGLLSLTGHTAPASSNQPAVREFLRNMGYTRQTDVDTNSSSGQDCFKITAQRKYTADNVDPELLKEQDVISVCLSKELVESSLDADIDTNDIIANESHIVNSSSDFVTDDEFTNNNGFNATMKIRKKSLDAGEVCFSGNGAVEEANACWATISFSVREGEIKPNIPDNNMIVGNKGNGGTANGTKYVYELKAISYEDDSISEDGAVKAQQFMMESYSNAYATARNFLGGSGAKEAITPEEQYEFYTYYLENFYNIKLSDGFSCVSEKPTIAEAVEKYYVKQDKGWCQHSYDWTNSNEVISAFVGYNGDDPYELKSTASVTDVIERLWLLSDAIEEEEIKEINKGIEEEKYKHEVEKAQSDPCFDVADSLGWIICPLITWMGDTASGLYAEVSQEFIVIDSGFFGDSGPVQDAWKKIVGFANTIMVIFLLVVVFSQLTGVGIDNYGIKKILPKIIVAAILINISFLICQLAVELSNILGDALNKMFTGWANDTISLSFKNGDVVNDGKGLFYGLLNGISGGILGIAGAEIAGTALTIASADSAAIAIANAAMTILLPLLCALVVIIVAVFFFFILLGVRKACVIVLVVLSPLAFVCYMLPNAKQLFQKWWKAFKGMLILYPICGLMIGGGYYVSKLITLSSGNYFVQFTAILLMVVPYFFIPKMLTSSFAAFGNIGAKISGFGRNLGGRMSKGVKNADKNLRGAIKSTDRFKDIQEREAEKRVNSIVGKLRNKQSEGKLSAYESRKLAKYQTAANEAYAKNLNKEAIINTMHQEAVEANLKEKFANDTVNSAMSLYKANYNTNDLSEGGVMNEEYGKALAAYSNNASEDNLAKIKALQNMLSGTEDGRNIIQRNLSAAAASGNTKAVEKAASHLASEHGGTYKAANRSLHKMINDMANGSTTAANNYSSGGYDIQSMKSYDAASFAAADEAAIKSAVETYNNLINKSNKAPEEVDFCNKLNSIANEINNSSNLHVKGKVKDELNRMNNRNSGSGYTTDYGGE